MHASCLFSILKMMKTCNNVFRKTIFFFILTAFAVLFSYNSLAQLPCHDTDGGINFYTKGTVSGISDDFFFTYTDYCEGDVLTEFYCQNNDLKNITFECENGCSDGRCNTCTPREERCAGNVIERCNLFGTGWAHYRNCPHGCEDARCIEKEKLSINASIQELIENALPTCFDSDGRDFYNKGFIEYRIYWFGNYIPGRTYDFCQGDFVNEQICAMGIPSFIRYRCEHGCEDGACRKTPKVEQETIQKAPSQQQVSGQDSQDNAEEETKQKIEEIEEDSEEYEDPEDVKEGDKAKKDTEEESEKKEGPVCGNNIIEGNEECDGTNLGGKTCESIGSVVYSGRRYNLIGGELRCTRSCRLYHLNCYASCRGTKPSGEGVVLGKDFTTLSEALSEDTRWSYKEPAVIIDMSTESSFKRDEPSTCEWHCKEGYARDGNKGCKLPPSPPAPDFEITECMELNQSGKTYALVKDIFYSGEGTTPENRRCFRITANWITLDCKGHKIDYKKGIGISVWAGSGKIVTGATVKNCVLTGNGIEIAESSTGNFIDNKITDVRTALAIVDSSGNTFSGNIIENTSDAAIKLFGSSYNMFTNNIVKGSTGTWILGSGIYISRNSNNNKFIQNIITENTMGIGISDSSGMTIKDNLIVGNNVGVEFSRSGCGAEGGHIVYNNYFNNKKNIGVSNMITANNNLNVQKVEGTNIVGGKYVGGNYWANPQGTGFSETCKKNREGFCNEPYKVNTYTDFLPLAS